MRKTVKVPCFINEKNEVLVTDNEKRDTIYNHFDNAFNDIDSVLDFVPDWLENVGILQHWICYQVWMLQFYEKSL